MLNDYKKKFILSNMTFAGIVLVLMLSSIFVYFYSRNLLNLTMTMAYAADFFPCHVFFI